MQSDWSPRVVAGAESKSAATISTVVSLLSTLCRGSTSITHDLLRSDLPDSIESALGGDERSILDTMRLVDLILVLLFEGRDALPKSGVSSIGGRIPGLRRLDSAGERSHRQLIDCIRNKDTDALIEAIDAGSELASRGSCRECIIVSPFVWSNRRGSELHGRRRADAPQLGVCVRHA